MKRVIAGAGVLMFASLVWGQQPIDRAKKAVTPESLQAEIEALEPADHVWRAIAWKTCPLEALKAAREQQKPIIAWVFLGTPTDERC
jgi:hypothetical protein